MVLDLTPNYLGSSGPWFSNSSVTIVAERLKVSADVTHMLLTAVQLNVPEISVRGILLLPILTLKSFESS